MTVIIFASKLLADTILREIAATPAITEGIGPVWCWYNPDYPDNDVQYNQSSDGRCAIAHPWGEVDRDWLAAYMDEWVVSGEVVITDRLPEDWGYSVE